MYPRCPANTTTISNELNKLYAPAIVDWQVILDKPFNLTVNPSGFQTEGTALLSKYTKEMNQVIKAYDKKRSCKKETLYLFFIDVPESEKQGFMPLTGQYGFIFNYASNNNVIGHELAHGAFNLRHTFSDKATYYLPERSTLNLMDDADGGELWKYQWDLIHDPESMVFSFLQDEDEGAMQSSSNYVFVTKSTTNTAYGLDILAGSTDEYVSIINAGTTELEIDVNPQSNYWITSSDSLKLRIDAPLDKKNILKKIS